MTGEKTLRGEPIVRVTRGGLVESIHEIAACAIDARGDVVFSAGSIDVPVYLRSTAKPFIAAAVIAAGAREKFGLEPQEIAVMAASHSGQPFHVDAVRSILSKIGSSEGALQCGIHPPYNAEAARALEEQGIAPGAVHNNCSGKHAGILALCEILGADPRTYLSPDNPAQQKILALCARLSDESLESMPLAVDGCGIPVYATPLRNAALSFSRFATLCGIDEADERALRIVRDAMTEYPEYVSGTGEFDTALMQVSRGTIAAKGGAEGVHGTAVIGRGGLALKVIDGNSRGRAPAALGILSHLHWLPNDQRRELTEFAEPALFNRAGKPVGEVLAVV